MTHREEVDMTASEAVSGGWSSMSIETKHREISRQLLAEIAVGQIREGVVRSLQDFGAFVDLGGLDGFERIWVR